MKRCLLLAGSMLLAGCAGVAEMRAEEPFATFTSSKSPGVLAACMAEAWTMQERWPQTPDVRINPISGGKQVMIYNSQSMSPAVFADITSTGSISKIVYYAKYREAYKQTFADLTRNCL